MSLASQGEILDYRQLFTCVATYRSTIVAVRKVRKKHIELTRTIRKELKVVNEFFYLFVEKVHVTQNVLFKY